MFLAFVPRSNTNPWSLPQIHRTMTEKTKMAGKTNQEDDEDAKKHWKIIGGFDAFNVRDVAAKCEIGVLTASSHTVSRSRNVS